MFKSGHLRKNCLVRQVRIPSNANLGDVFENIRVEYGTLGGRWGWRRHLLMHGLAQIDFVGVRHLVCDHD